VTLRVRDITRHRVKCLSPTTNMSSKLAIAPVTSTLPTCNPNLMPFHISYTGPAAVSTYMRVEKLKPAEVIEESKPQEAAANTTLSAQTTLESIEMAPKALTMDVEMTAEVQTSSTGTPDVDMQSVSALAASRPLTATTSESTIVVESDSQASLSSDATLSSIPPLEDADKRFVSTFRGRSIHGLTIDLPPGYVGLVLKGASDSSNTSDTQAKEEKKTTPKGKAKVQAAQDTEMAEPVATSRRRGRLTRSAAPKIDQVITIEDEPEPEPEKSEPIVVDDDEDNASSEQLRTLLPTAQFSSFTLWQADRTVDKSRDEYYRTLTEWIALSHEVRMDSFSLARR